MGKHPTDRGKTGTQRHVRTAGHGVPIGLAVDGAHRHDGQMARATSASLAVERPDAPPDAPQGLGLETG